MEENPTKPIIYEKIVAKEICLSDDDGNIRAQLILEDGNPTFTLHDQKDKLRFKIAVEKNGYVRLSLLGRPDGIDRSNVTMSVSEDGKPQVALATKVNHAIWIQFHDDHPSNDLADDDERANLRTKRHGD